MANLVQAQQANEHSRRDSLSLPVSFSWRHSPILPKVRRQPTGGCWASSALITVESTLRKTENDNFIFSDKNLQLFHGFSQSRNTNGNHHMATAYFSRWSGPVIKNPKTDTIQSTPDDLPYHLTEARYLPTDPVRIKHSLMEFGPVYSMLVFHKADLDTISHILYAHKSKINHVVVLCGWNDTLLTRQGRGVWIAQNSLGIQFGDSGFSYIPYQDENILQYNAIWPRWEKNAGNSKLYYYDTLGSYESYGFRDSVCYGLVKFTATQAGMLTRTGSFINKPNSNLRIWVYNNFNEETHELSGKLGTTSNRFFTDPGYYTLDLLEGIPLDAGEDFYVMARYSTPNDSLPIPVESFFADYSDPQIQSGKCWINPDFEKWPTTWYACGMDSDYPYLHFDLNIRAIVETRKK